MIFITFKKRLKSSLKLISWFVTLQTEYKQSTLSLFYAYNKIIGDCLFGNKIKCQENLDMIPALQRKSLIFNETSWVL